MHMKMVITHSAVLTVLLLLQLPSSSLSNTLRRIIDLSKDFPQDTAAMTSSPGAAAIQQAASRDPLVRAAIVLEHGDIVASYHRDDVDPNETTFHVFSTTKSFTSLLIGMLVEDGLLSLNETLGDVFPNNDAWADVTDGSTDFRKNVTIEEILTMTSGLITPPDGMFDLSWGGSSLEDSLSYPDVGVKGEFSYLGVSNIPSYIIKERSGMNPRLYLANNVMDKLGIGEDEYNWQQNLDGVEFGYHGLELTPTQMAKFGQLYLQGGRINPSNDDRLISQEWIDASFTQHATEGTFGMPYGYLFWGHPFKSTAYCALGLGAQDVCVDRDLGRVVIQQRDLNFEENGGDMQGLEHLIVTPVALNESLSFRVANDGLLSSVSPTVSPSRNNNDAGTAEPSTARKEDEGKAASQTDRSGTSNPMAIATSLWIFIMSLSVLVAVY
jgi:CubicO group peptidase (beta-lactamase class C family)